MLLLFALEFAWPLAMVNVSEAGLGSKDPEVAAGDEAAEEVSEADEDDEVDAIVGGGEDPGDR